MVATYVLEVDWDNSSVFDGGIEDITGYASEIEYTRGRDYASMLTGKSTSGTLTARLNNDDGRFNSFNTASAIGNTNIVPGRRVRLRTTAPSSVTRWQGFLDHIEPQPDVSGHHHALLRAIGPLGYLNQKKVHTSGNTNQLTGAAIGVVLDAAAWAAGDRTIDAGQTTIIRWWEDETPAFDALRDIEEQEVGFLTESRDGKIVFEDRNHRLAGSHLTSQATWSDVAGGSIRYAEIEQMDPLKEIYNIIEIPCQRFTVGALAVLWTLAESGANSPYIDPGETLALWATYPSFSAPSTDIGVDAWTTPVATTDYLGNAAADGSGANLTSSLGVAVTKRATSMEIVVTNNHASSRIYLTFFRARGTPIAAGNETIVRVSDATSIAKYGERTFLFPAPFHGSSVEAASYGNYILSIYSKPIPVLRVKISGSRAAAHLTEIQSRDLSDHITISAAGVSDLGIAEDFFVENEHHLINVAQHEWATYELSPSSGYTGFWILGTSLLGQTTRLGW